MKHFVKTNAKRIAAAILCAVMCIAALPFSAFAFTAEEGKTVNAYYGAKYIGFDGEKYHITVPCGICGETHTAICGPERILQGATALGCAQTKQFCCFIGPEGTVEKNLRELAILAEKEKQQEGEGNQEAFVDNVIMYEVLSELKDIAARGGIRCTCGSAEYGIQVHRDAVDLICRRCGGKLRLPAGTDEDLDRLCCQMKLTIRGAE